MDQKENGGTPELDPRILQLAERFKRLRQKAGFTSSEKFANEHGINRPQYAEYEVGKDLQFTTLLRIIDAHKITLAEFFSEGFD